MSEDSFDSLDKNNSFYRCVSKLEDTLLNNFKLHEDEINVINNNLYDKQNISGGKKKKPKVNSEKGKEKKYHKIEEDIKTKNLDISHLEILKDIKIGEIVHKEQKLDIFLDRNKKKYVNYKGRKVYT